jgi:hypothetical protein
MPPQTAARLGNTLTHGARYVDPLLLSIDDIDMRDIAHSLSNICRWNGHGRFFSVAQHSVLCSEVARSHKFELLLHDSSETYICDLSSAIKHGSPLGELYREIEAGVEAIIEAKFNLTPGAFKLPAVKAVDDQLLHAEAFHLFAEPYWWADPTPALREMRIESWLPEEAEARFLSRFDELHAGRASAGNI